MWKIRFFRMSVVSCLIVAAMAGRTRAQGNMGTPPGYSQMCVQLQASLFNSPRLYISDGEIGDLDRTTNRAITFNANWRQYNVQGTLRQLPSTLFAMTLTNVTITRISPGSERMTIALLSGEMNLPSTPLYIANITIVGTGFGDGYMEVIPSALLSEPGVYTPYVYATKPAGRDPWPISVTTGFQLYTGSLHYVAAYLDVMIENVGDRISLPGSFDIVAELDSQDGFMDICEVINNGDIWDQDACRNSLASGKGTIINYKAHVLNISDGAPSGHFGKDDPFGVVMQGHREQGSVDHLALRATGILRIPGSQGGPYTFGVNSDDGFTLQFPGHNFDIALGGEISNLPNGDAMCFDSGRAQADTLGWIDLPAGDHFFDLTFHETTGSACVEFFAARGWQEKFDSHTFQLVGYRSEGSMTLPGFAGEVTVIATAPGKWSGGQIDNLEDAMAAVEEAQGSWSLYKQRTGVVNYCDPENAGYGGSFAADLAFPSNTWIDDDNFALKVEGWLDIPESGMYELGFNSDDGALLSIPGQPWNSIVKDATGDAIVVGDLLINGAPTDWSLTAAEIYLDAGQYEFEALMYERGGGAFFELIAIDRNGMIHLLETDGAGFIEDQNGLELVSSDNLYDPNDLTPPFIPDEDSGLLDPNYPTRYPIGSWSFDLNQGRTAYDDSLNGHNGTLMGDVQWTTDGFGTSALDFPGYGYVEIPNHPDFDITGPITITAWIKVYSFDSNWQAIVTKGDTAYRIQRDSWKRGLEFACTGLVVPDTPYGNVLGSVNVSDGQWHHIAGVYDGTMISLYVDSELDTSASAVGTIATNNFPVQIGANAQQAGRDWNGLIDEVNIYDTALSQAQIIALMEMILI